jgi:hypothetical protein
MPDIKRYSTGRVGNTYPEHLSTDHVNTKGLDGRGLPGIEAFIDEDIVRSYDDNRPLINLLSNDETISRATDSSIRILDVGAALRNDNEDWRLTIGDESYFCNPENFDEEMTVTPIKIARGTAYSTSRGYISTGFKKIAGFRRSDDTSLWVDEHSWYYSAVITLDDPLAGYAGLYRPIYVELPESTLPDNYQDYQISVRQILTTGNIYTYPIYSKEDLLIPYKSSIFSVINEALNFDSAAYPGYDFYPESYIQLESGGLGALEISEDIEVFKNLRREEHKLSASDFNSEAGVFKADLKESVFRKNKEANVNRIENDVNFIRSMNGVKAYNGTSRVYFNDFKNLLGVLQPLKDSRNFLGDQLLSFELSIVNNVGDQDTESEGFYFLNGETSLPYTVFDGVSGVPNPPNTVIARSNELGIRSFYSTKVSWTVNHADNWVCGVMNYPAIYESGSGLNMGTNIVYERAWIYIPSTFKFDSTTNNWVYLTAIGWKQGILPADPYSTFVSFGLSTSIGGTNETPTRWAVRLAGDSIQYSTTNFSLDAWHEITLRFVKGNPGGGAVYVDGLLLYSNLALNYSTYNANRIFIGTGYSSGTGGTVRSGSYFYIDDIKADRFPITYDDKYEVIHLSSPETRGYKDFGLSVVNPNAALGLSALTYNFNIKLNNDTTYTTVSTPLIPSDTLYTVRDKVQIQIDALGIYAHVRVFLDGPTYEMRIYSKSSGSYSKVAITSGVTNDLAFNLGGSYAASVNGTSDWPIYFNPSVPGLYEAEYTAGAVISNDFASGDVGYRLFYGLINAGFDNFKVAINTNTGFSHTCELYIEPSDVHTQGRQDLNMNVPDPSIDSGLLPLSEYYFQLNIDGAGLEEFSVVTTTDTTYAGIINVVNSILAGRASFSFTPGNDVRISSDSYGPTSSIQTGDGITGNSLFGFAYPASGFTPSAQHLTPVVGTGRLIYIRPRKIDTFAIHTDGVKERLVYSHDSLKHVSYRLYITPDTLTNYRDNIDTEHAYITETSTNKWSTHNDRTLPIDLSTHASWEFGAIITKVYSLTIGVNKHLLVGNSLGQIFYCTNGDLYNEDFVVSSFTLFTSGVLGQHREKINNFFVYDDTTNNKKFLFILTGTHVYYSEVTSGLSAGQVFTSLDTSFDVPNVSGIMFRYIYDAVSWDAKVDATHTNKYIIIVGCACNLPSTWEYAPILYGLYNSTTFTFEWYGDEIYKKTQINDIRSIKKFNGWMDPEQGYQLFINNNVNGPEILAGNSQNNWQNIGGPGDERFNRFSWVEANLESGKDAFGLDDNIDTLTSLAIFDNRIFAGGTRSSDVYAGFYSYGLKKLQDYFAIDTLRSYVSSDGTKLYSSVYQGVGPNSDPAVIVVSQEINEGRAQIFSADNLVTVANWPSDSAFRILLNGFNVGGINYDGEYNVVFNGQGKSNLTELVDAINGDDPAAEGFAKAIPTSNPLITIDLTPVIRIRALTSLEKFGNTYTERYKLVIESKTSEAGEGSGHSSIDETTQSDCYFTIYQPTTGTSIVGTGSDKLQIDPNTTGYANLQLVDWSGAECYQVKRISSSSLVFGGNSYVSLSSIIPASYKILTGSFRLKTNSTDEQGFSQGFGKIIKTTTPLSLAAGTYTFEVVFNENLTPVGVAEVTDVICPSNAGGILGGKYWLLNSPSNYYYVWYNSDGLSTNPAVPGRIGIAVVVASGAPSTTVASLTQAAINPLADFNASVGASTVTVTNTAIGNVVNASDFNAGVTPTVTTQGSNSAPIRNLVVIDGASVTTIATLLTQINADLSGGIATLQPIGATAEYCDIVITSNYIGTGSTVNIREVSFGTYMFTQEALDLVLNQAIPGSTGLGTPGSQTLGFTWENADYFIEYNHPDTVQVRIYIPNGTTRIDTGDTVWADFWAWKLLTKISAKIGDPPANNIPTAGQWTFDIEQKKIVVGDQPSTVSPEDLIFVDAKVKKTLSLMDLTTSLPIDQTELSDEFYGLQPRNLTNSEISVARPLARLSALHYGVALWGTDEIDSVLTDYSFFLPRVDLVVATRDPDIYGNKVKIIKGIPDPINPRVEPSLNTIDDNAMLYAAFINSQDYNENDIVTIPWNLTSNIEKGKIYLTGSTQYFRSKNDFISTRGLRPTKGAFDLNKITINGDYDLVRVTDPVGVYNFRKRKSDYLNLDSTEVIFVDGVNGNDLNSGTRRDDALKTIQAAVTATTNERPYIIVERPVDTSEITETTVTIPFKAFRVYLISEYIVRITNLNISGLCYLEGIKVIGAVTLNPFANIIAKYCDIETLATSTTGTFSSGLSVTVYNSIIHNSGISISGTLTIPAAVNVLFEHVYVSESAQLLNFNPASYNSAVQNTFIFNYISNDKNSTGNAIVCPYSTRISIQINSSTLPADTSTKFNSNAAIVINESLTYLISNAGTGSVVTNNSQLVSVGDIDLISGSGAPTSIARGYDSDSLALKYINKELDAGAFLEERISRVSDIDEQLEKESFLNLIGNRPQYQHNTYSDKFAFYIRFKPTLDYQQTGVLFDSRYIGDFDFNSGLFNQNAADFIQIVYNNETYSRDDLTADKYCFKFVTSNGSATSVSVIGPFFTVDDYSEYNNWHEISVLMHYADIYNPKYKSADLTGNDKARKQMMVYTMYDRDIDKIYTLKNEPYEDSGRNEIITSNWYPGNIIGKYFNIGGGWLASWIPTLGGYTWSVWSEANYKMLVDDFMVSSDVLPLNILKDFGEKIKIDTKANDYTIPRFDDNRVGVILHCNNPHPFSDNGLQPYDSVSASFRQYEGIASHGLAIESASPNLLVDGRIKSGNWFDRSEARIWDATTNWIIWGALTGSDGADVAVLVTNTAGDLRLIFIDPSDGSSIISNVAILTGSSISQAIITKIGSKYVIGYIPSDFKFYFKTVDAGPGHAVSSAHVINNAATSYISACQGHSSSQVAFCYRDNTSSLGYATVMNTGTGAVVIAATQIGNGADIMHNAITETADKDGNPSYTIVYREAVSSWLKFVMWEDDFAATVYPHDTLIQTDTPIDIKTTTFIDGQLFVKWKDYNAGSDSPVKAAYINREGTELVPPFEVYAFGDDEERTDDFVQARDFKIILAIKNRTTGYVHFRVYQETGTIVSETVNSPYLRPFDESAVGKVILAVPDEGSTCLLIDINNGIYNAGNVVELQDDIPSRWFHDFTGVFDQFDTSAQRTRNLFGWAYYQRFNHVVSAGETGIFVADAETNNLSAWSTYVPTDGSVTTTAAAAAHGNYGYQFTYDGTGADLRLVKLSLNQADVYVRFYLELDRFFALIGTAPRRLEIARLSGASTLLTLRLEYSDPTLGGDGKFKLYADAGAFGNGTTVSSVINYSTSHYIEMRWVNHITNGGWQLWADGALLFSQLGQNTIASGNFTTIQVGSNSAGSSTPAVNSILYFDDVRADSAYIGAYTAGLGQGEIWQEVNITNPDTYHFVGCFYWILSGKWTLRLEGTALSQPIQFTFQEDPEQPVIHDTSNTDSVDFTDRYEINFNRINRFIARFIPDSVGTIKVRLMSTNTSGQQVDEFFVDNIKVENGEHPTSIEAETEGYIEYPYSVKSKGSAFFRFLPEFFIGAVETDHTLFAAYSTDELGVDYVTHRLYYDQNVNKFKFYITDALSGTAQVESDEYGDASTIKQFTDLREQHTIVCNWDVANDYIEMIIDSHLYRDDAIGLGLFNDSKTVVIGNVKAKNEAADSIFDLIRIGEEALGVRQLDDLTKKQDPFFIQNKTDIGAVSVSGLSFYGITSFDLYERTIYTEKKGDSWRLVIDKGLDFGSEITIRHDERDIVVFGTTGVFIDGSLSVGTLIAQTTATINTTDDHLTLRYGFSGSPPDSNDGYIEVERGNPTNSEIRWDESQRAWTIHDGSTNQISIDGRSIGSWANDENFNLASNGVGAVKIFANTSTDPGTGDGKTQRTVGDEKASFGVSEIVFNGGGLDTDLRVRSYTRPHMLFMDAGNSKFLVGRLSGLAPSALGYLVVNETATIQNSGDLAYGKIEFRNNTGILAGYVGGGDGSTYWTLTSDASNFLRSNSVIEMGTGKSIRWQEDPTNSALAYTADAPNQITGTSDHGIYCYGSFTAYKIYNGVWNDYAEAFEFDKEFEKDPQPGFMYKMTENGIIKTDQRCDPATVGIYSDTYGQLMGSNGIYDSNHIEGHKLPIGLMGRIRVWVKEELNIGDPLISDVDGYATKATAEERRDYPDLIIGKVMEASKDNTEKRIWILIK